MRYLALAFLLALMVAACTPPGAPVRPAGGAAGPANPPGLYIPNGEIDGSSGKIALQHLDTMKFAPNTVTRVKAGSTLTLEMKNAGSTIHSIIAPTLGLPAKVALSGGQSGTATFTAPAQPGTYPFWCPEPGHGEAGMSGQVVVE